MAVFFLTWRSSSINILVNSSSTSSASHDFPISVTASALTSGETSPNASNTFLWAFVSPSDCIWSPNAEIAATLTSAESESAALNNVSGAFAPMKLSARLIRPTWKGVQSGFLRIPSNVSIASGPIVAMAPAEDPSTTGSSSSKNASNKNGNAALSPIKLIVFADALLTTTFL